MWNAADGASPFEKRGRLGRPAFIAGLERETGRILHLLKPGPKRMSGWTGVHPCVETQLFE